MCLAKVFLVAALAGFAASVAPAQAQFGGFGANFNPNFLSNGPAVGAGFGNDTCPPFRGPCNPVVEAPLFFNNPGTLNPNQNVLLERANSAFLGAFGISRISRLFGFP